MRVVGLAGWSGSGKTTLVARVIPVLTGRGLRVSTVKHAHHGFDVDIPGKDSHTHRAAGASEVFVSSARRWAHIHELRDEGEPQLAAILRRLAPVDLVIVEGYKRHPHPKLEVYRAEVGKPLLHPEDDWIVAVASDAPVPDARVPVLDLGNADKIADVLMIESLPAERLAAEPERV
jgi:molybdopterin-guanine dinucleotide biosynthesis adapter protein